MPKREDDPSRKSDIQKIAAGNFRHCCELEAVESIKEHETAPERGAALPRYPRLKVDWPVDCMMVQIQNRLCRRTLREISALLWVIECEFDSESRNRTDKG